MVWPTFNEKKAYYDGWILCGEPSTKHQGWKIHVVAEPSQEAVNAIDAVCKKNSGILWKYLKSEDAFNGQKEEQRGKWNCVYPNSTLVSMALAVEISQGLRQAQAIEFGQDQRPPHDKYAWPFICVRYGPYTGDRLINEQGKLVKDIWKTNAYHPPWVKDPWVYLGALMTPGNTSRVNLGKPYPEYRAG